MGKMDFRYFNQETGKWESAIVGPEEFIALQTLVDNSLPSIANGANVYSRFPEVCKTLDGWNTAQHNGLYMVNGADGPTIDWSYGEMIVHDDKWSTQYVKSLGNRTGEIHEYLRDKQNGVWTPWRRRLASEAMYVSPQGLFPARATLNEALGDVGGVKYPMTWAVGGNAFYRTNIPAAEVGLWELVYFGNPNAGGSGNYRCGNIGTMEIIQNWDGTAWYNEIRYTESFRSTGIGGMYFVVTCEYVSADNSQVATSVHDPSGWVVRVQVGGFMPGYNVEGLNSNLVLRRVGI